MDRDRDHRVLIFAPIGRDAPASAELLKTARVDSVICRDLGTLVREIGDGVGAIFVAEEGLFGKDLTPLAHWVESQPPWSDVPFIVLTSQQQQPAVVAWRRNLADALRNVSFLERPVQPITFTSAILSALRARRRQYEVRAMLRTREDAAQELERLVVERTRALEQTNEQLGVEMAERARIAESLRQAQKIEAIGQLTGGIAHDFNNLLMVISGGLEMIDRQSNPERRQRLKDGMMNAAQRGARLTRQLLTFSRRQQLRPEPVDIAQLIGGMRELLDRSLRGDVHVQLDFSDALWPVEIDPGELELVVLNLAVNARDAMPKGGTIVLRGENVPDVRDEQISGDFVRLSVIDTGTGMSAEVKAHVFEPYFTTKDPAKGSGLGLAQVYGFAMQSHGMVRLESEVGRGTNIALYLPRSDKVPASDRSHDDGQASESRLKLAAGHVLLVEDDDEVAALATEMLDELGYEVTRAATGAAALGALANGRPIDIVLSDIMMPGGMSGIELAGEIRRRRAELPVLLTSGYAEVVAKTGAEGMHILRKPFRLDELSDALLRATSNPVRLVHL